MAGKRYSPVTLAGVAILVGGIYMVGTKVDQPPKAPPAPPPTAPATPVDTGNMQQFVKPTGGAAGNTDPQSVADGIKAQILFQQKMQFKAKRERDLWGGKTPPKTDEISPVYFSKGEMGASGEAKAENLAAKKKQIDAIVSKEMATKFPGGMKPPPLQMSPNQLMDPTNHGKQQLVPAQKTVMSKASAAKNPAVSTSN